MWVTKQLEAIRAGDDVQEAALALGLLVEREKTRRVGDDGIEEALGAELAQRRLSPAEVDCVVEQLLAYLREADSPHPMTVWALTKSYDERIVPVLLELLERDLLDPDRETLCHYALLGIINTGVGSAQYGAQALRAIERASAKGSGVVAETASDYLQVMKP